MLRTCATRPLGTGSVLELSSMESSTEVVRLDVVFAYPADPADASAVDAAQVAGNVLVSAIEAADSTLHAVARGYRGRVYLIVKNRTHTDLSKSLATILGVIAAPTVTTAHLESARRKYVDSLTSPYRSGARNMPNDLGLAKLLYNTPPPELTLTIEEQLVHIRAIDAATIANVYAAWKRGYVRVVLTGGKLDPDATAKLVGNVLTGWTLGPYVPPPGPPKPRVPQGVVRAPSADAHRSVQAMLQVDAASEADAMAIALAFDNQAPVATRLFHRGVKTTSRSSGTGA